MCGPRPDIYEPTTRCPKCKDCCFYRLPISGDPYCPHCDRSDKIVTYDETCQKVTVGLPDDRMLVIYLPPTQEAPVTVFYDRKPCPNGTYPESPPRHYSHHEDLNG